MADRLLIENARLVDGKGPEPRDGVHVLVEGGRIAEVADRPIAAAADRRIDARGRTLLPGLIDCHVHVVASLVDLGRNALLPDSLVAARAARIMHGMLMRGFTTVRDVGGADIGLKLAVEEGAILGPRLVIAGKALSQTGGHGDPRGRFDRRDAGWQEQRLGALGRLCDGVDAVRRAAREEIKAGADLIKVMANGGIASPTDPIHFLGFARDELRAAVEEAANAGTYVAAHLYTDAAIRRAVECGVRSLEHCNLIEPATAALAAAHGCTVCPTLVTYERLARDGAALGLPPESVAKIEDVRRAGLRSLEILRGAGVPMVFGTDLLGPMHEHQADEWLIRAEALPAHEVIRSATGEAARLLGRAGELGCVAPGAVADLLLVAGDPLRDLAALTGQGRRIELIVQAGRVVKDAPAG
jgi:imidazolonepropionase-like amidohydrolase